MRFEYAYQNKRQSRYGSGRSENAVLLGIVGRRFAIHIYRAARRFHNERLDEKENTMIACCSDGTRPVIFKIERIDYDD